MKPSSQIPTLNFHKYGEEGGRIYFNIPIVRQKGVAYGSGDLISYLPYTNLSYKVCKLISTYIVNYNDNDNNKKIMNVNHHDNTHLYLIHLPSLWIPITMNYNSIVAFIYEVCTSTYIIEIRRTPGPLVQLLQEL